MKNLVLKTKNNEKWLKTPLAFETPQDFKSMNNSKKNAAPSSEASCTYFRSKVFRSKEASCDHLGH